MAQQTISELIEQNKGGRSYEQLQEDAGGTPSRSRWHQLQNAPLQDFPNKATLEGIAKALRRPPYVVAVACMASIGWQTGPQQAELLDRLGAYDLSALTSDQCEAIVSVVTSMLR